MGAKHTPIYRIVCVDSRVRRDGKYIQQVGHYDATKHTHDFDKEAVLKFLKEGAKPTLTVKQLLVKENIRLEKANAAKKDQSKPAKKRKLSAKRKASLQNKYLVRQKRKHAREFLAKNKANKVSSASEEKN